MRAKATAIFFTALLALPTVSVAEESEEPGKLAAVQKRKFRMDHEIFAAAGFTPLDAFYKGIGPIAGYALHFNDVFAWEIVRGGYSFNLNTSLRTQLEKDFGVAPTRFDEMLWMAGTALMVTPFYGKLSFINHSVMHTELFLLIGGTVGKFTQNYKPGPQAGLGLRFFLSNWISLRVEGRYHYLFSSKPSQVVDLALGLSFSLGGTD
jgi:outer membrane beta-barrel protein